MWKKIFLFCSLLFLLVIAGCSEKSGANEGSKKESKSGATGTKQEADKPESAEFDTTVINVLEWPEEDFTEADQKKVRFEKMTQPSSPIDSFANNGTFIIRGNSYSYFYDYENGKMSPFTFEGMDDPLVNNDMYSRTYLFDSHYYVVEPDRSAGKAYLKEIDVDSGKEKSLIEVNGSVQLSKDEDTLYIATADKLLALDTNLEKEIWETGLDTDLRFTENEVTDDLVILMGEEGLAAYNRADGEKLYEVEGYFHSLASDGNTYYVTKENEESSNDNGVVLNVLKFTGQDEEGEQLFQTPELIEPNEEDDFQLDVVGDTLYVKSANGLLAYDKDGSSLRWILAVGEELSKETDTLYDFKTDYAEDRVYIRVTKWESGPEQTLFMAADATTGEMIKNLRIDSGETVGPNVDGDQAVIFRKIEDDNPEIYIMKE